MGRGFGLGLDIFDPARQIMTQGGGFNPVEFKILGVFLGPRACFAL
jgi:hypothetical protein